MEAPAILPSPSAVPRRLLELLDANLKAREDLSKLPSLASRLGRDCEDLELDLGRLNAQLSLAASAWISLSDEAGEILRQLDFRRASRAGDSESGRRMLRMEVPLLVKEVGRIETVQLYAETTLQLEALVGNLEDLTHSIMGQSTRNKSTSIFLKIHSKTETGAKNDNLHLAIKAMKDIERILVTLTNNRPRWNNLILSVDSRVEKTLGILRPQTLSDHRILLASLEWPPSLSASKLEKDARSDIPNPLILMQGDKKVRYSQSFLGLCALQHLQSLREARHSDHLRYQKGCELPGSFNMNNQPDFHQGLWAIDELVHPMASRMEYHFSRWSDQPKFIFALVYKTTRDFMDGVDNVLQPLIDQAMFVGCSAKEAWVSAMVKMLCEYLERRTFPVLAKSYGGIDGNIEVTSNWLHLVDLMISFDKRMQALASSGTPLMGLVVELEGFSRSLSIMSVFNDHQEWLQIWVKIELKDAEDKLKSELEDNKSWLIDIKQQSDFSNDTDSFFLSSREDYRAPPITDSVVRLMWAMIERGRILPNKSLRVQFIRACATPFLDGFIIFLFHRCQPMEAIMITEESILVKVAASINAARYCESVLREWSEDINLVETNVAKNYAAEQMKDDQSQHNFFFEDEIKNLMKLETDCLVELVSSLLLKFDSLCWYYVQNLEQWEEEVESGKDHTCDEETLNVSPEFSEALDMIKDSFTIMKQNLNSKDFLDLWRSIAAGLDHFIFSSIPLSVAKFSHQGVDRFRADMRALLLLFKPLCARPEAFFPHTSDSLGLLEMPQKKAMHLLGVLLKGENGMEEFLRLNGVLHVSCGQAVKILSSKKA